MRGAVVGHVEWVEFVRVRDLPGPGDIVHAGEWWQEPAGGGSVAAVQLSRLGADTTFFTALGDDELGHRAHRELEAFGLDVCVTFRAEATRRAITFIDRTGERTIIVLGNRLAPRRGDDLPWERLESCDCVYFTAGDAAALRAARSAGVVVATARVMDVVKESRVHLDALVGSKLDDAEQFDCADLEPVPRLCVWTEGGRGGTFSTAASEPIPYSPVELEKPIVDRYGAGDAFAAGLTFSLGEGKTPELAISFATRCGAAALGGRGAYEGQLRVTL